MQKQQLRQNKIARAHKRVKDYKRKKNILKAWRRQQINKAKTGAKVDFNNPPVKFPKSK